MTLTDLQKIVAERGDNLWSILALQFAMRDSHFKLKDAKFIATFGTIADEIMEVLHVAQEAAEKHWFDPSDKAGGACIWCDANLHENTMGIHKQINGDPCFVQTLRDAYEKLKAKLAELK